MSCKFHLKLWHFEKKLMWISIPWSYMMTTPNTFASYTLISLFKKAWNSKKESIPAATFHLSFFHRISWVQTLLSFDFLGAYHLSSSVSSVSWLIDWLNFFRIDLHYPIFGGLNLWFPLQKSSLQLSSIWETIIVRVRKQRPAATR